MSGFGPPPMFAGDTPGFGFPAPSPQDQVAATLRAQMPQPPQPDFSIEAMLRDPSIQALLQPTPFPDMAQQPDRAMLQPHGFLESLAQSAPSILEGLGNAHPRNFGEGLLTGLVGGVTSGLARRGAETLSSRQSAYQQQGDAATARNKMLADAWQENEKSRLQSFHQALVKGYEERNKQANAADLIPTPAGLAKVYADNGVTLPAKITEKQHDALARLRPYPGGPYVTVPGIGPVASATVYTQDREDARSARGRAATAAAAGDTGYLEGLVNTTHGGRKFLDVSSLTGKDKGLAVKWASARGLPVAGAAELADLREVDTALRNNESIQAQMEALLPTDPQQRASGFMGRRFSQIFQSSPQRAAFNSWRTAAIRNLRATAGSKGLRINQAEIEMAIKNDIPSLNDTYGTALAKLANIKTMLEHTEEPILSRDWSRKGTPPAATDSVDAWLQKNGTPAK